LGGEATLAKFNPNGSSSASSTMIIPDPSEEGQVRIFLNKLAEEDLYMPLWTRELFLLMDKDSGKHKNKHLLGYFFHHNVQAHITKANALFEKGQFEEAIDFYKAALKTYPQNPEARYNISVCWSRIGNHEIKNNCMAAEAAFTMALEYNPKNIDALNRLSMIYAVNDDFKSVEKISRRLLELLDTEDFNRDSSLRLIKNASIDEMRTISQGNLGMALVYQYSSQKGIGSLEEAIGHLESAKKAQSDSPNHDLNLSLAYLGVENLENAIECTNSYFDNPKTANSVLAIRLINDYLHYAINNHLTAEKKPELGSVFSRMIEVITGFSDDTIANKDGAVVDLTTATIYLARIGIKNLADQLGEHLLEICRSKQHQDLYFACYERAIVLYDSKRHEEALILLEEILSNDKNTNYNIYSEFTGDSSPLKANAMNLMSQIRKKIAERDKDETQMEQAIELVEQAIEEYPETAILHYSRGNLLETRNKTESSDLTRAANSYKIAIEKCPEFMIAHLALIDAYRQLNKQGKMQKAIERAKAELTIVLDEPDQAEYLIATDFIEELIKLYIKSKDMTLYKMIQLCRKKGPQDGLRSALDNIPDLPIELLNIQADLN